MSTQYLIMTLVMGAVSGWLAGHLMRGHGLGLVRNIVVGVIGAFIGSWLFGVLGIRVGTGLVRHLIEAVGGASVLLLAIGFVARR
jgi:uncharacterized membrane protein YeaQ/YmgE (transglycosylase-associated protein family)